MDAVRAPLAAFTNDRRSLPEVHGTVPVPGGFWRKVLAYAGPLLADLMHGTTVSRVRHELAIPVLLLRAK